MSDNQAERDRGVAKRWIRRGQRRREVRREEREVGARDRELRWRETESSDTEMRRNKETETD